MKKTKRRERRGSYERDFTLDKGRDLDGTFEGGNRSTKQSRKNYKDHNFKD